MGGLRRPHQIVVAGRLQRTVGDVVCDGVVEQGDVLAHQGHVIAQVGEAEVADVVPIEPDDALAGLIESGQQVHQRGLAGTGTSDQGHGLPRRDVQIDVLEHRLGIGVVAKADVFVTDGAADRRQLEAAGIPLRVAIQKLEHALRGGDAPLQGHVDRGQPLGVLHEQQHRREIGAELAHFQIQPEGGVDHEREGHRHDELDHRRTQGIGDGQLEELPPVVAVDVVEAPGLVGLAAEDPDLPVGADDLLRHARHVTHGILDAPAQLAEPLAHVHHQRHQQGRAGQQDQRQFRTVVHEQAQQRQDGQAVADDDGDHRGSRLGELLHVVDHLRQQAARGRGVVVAHRQAHELFEHLTTQIPNHRTGHVGHAVTGEKVAEDANGKDDDDEDRNPGKGLRIPFHEAVVEQRLDDAREGRFRGGEDDHPQHRQQEHRHVGTDVAQQTAVDGHPVGLRCRAGHGVSPDWRPAGWRRSDG